LHNLSIGVEPFPFSRTILATIHVIANTGAMLKIGQKRSRDKTALTVESDCGGILKRLLGRGFLVRVTTSQEVVDAYE